MAENAYFFTKEKDECLPNFVIFGKNKLLEISDNLNDDECSLFIEENRSISCILTHPTGLPKYSETCKNIP